MFKCRCCGIKKEEEYSSDQDVGICLDCNPEVEE